MRKMNVTPGYADCVMAMLRITFSLLGLTLLGFASAIPLRIASVSPLTGGLTVSGTELKRGAELAVLSHLQEFKALGYELTLTSFDDQGSPTFAQGVAQTIENDPSILGVVGAYNSSVSNVLGETFAPSKLAIVSISTNDKLTHNGWSNFNRVVAPDGAQSVAAAKYILQLSPKAIYVISDNTVYGNGLTKSLIQQLNSTSVKLAGYSGVSTSTEITRIAQLVKASGASTVYFGGTDDVGGRLAKAFDAAQVKVNLIGSDGIDSPNFIHQVVGLAANISYTTVFGPLMLFSSGASFNDRYKAAYPGSPASGVAAYSYDATEALLAGLQAAVVAARKVPTREQISDAVRNINLPACFGAENACKTITGALAFSKTGERSRSTVLVMRYNNMLQTQMIKKQVINASDLK